MQGVFKDTGLYVRAALMLCKLPEGCKQADLGIVLSGVNCFKCSRVDRHQP